MAKWIFGAALVFALSLSAELTWVHFALATIAAACAALTTKD